MLSAPEAGEAAFDGDRKVRSPEWKLIPPEQALTRLADTEYRKEAVRSGDGFSHPDCLAAAARAAAREGSTVLMAEGHVGRQRMLIPLRVVRSLGIRQVVPLSAPMNQYAPAPAGPISATALRELVATLVKENCGDLLLLRRVREDNPLRETLQEIGAAPSQQAKAPFVDLAAFPSFDAYVESFSRKVLRARRRKLARLEEIGKVEFKVLSGLDGEEPLRHAFEWKRLWLQMHGIGSPVLDGANWEAALLECACASHAVVSVLSIGGAPAAVELGFVDDDCFVAYLGAFDPVYAKLSIGQEQMSRTIAWCFEQGHSRYDLLPPADDYKLHWTRNGTAVPVADYTVPLSKVGKVASMVHQRLRPFARRIVLSAPASVRRILVRGPTDTGHIRTGFWPSVVLILALLDPAIAGY